MEIGIQKLTPAQLKKLESGQPVRAKLGSAHIVKVNMSDVKKLMSASKKGSAATIKGAGLVKKSNEFAEAARPYTVNKTVSPIKQAASTSAVTAISKKGKGAMPKGAKVTLPVETTKPHKFGAGMCGCEGSCGCGIAKSSVSRAMKEFRQSKKVGNRAVEMDGGKVNRRKKFDQWFKSIGSKFKTLNHNLQPIKKAASDRAADYIKYEGNPQAQAQAAIDMAQAEARDTRQLVRPGRKGKQSAAPTVTILPRVPVPESIATQPIAVDVNDDGEADGFFTPNEMRLFGAGKKRKPSSSPWIAHVKAYAAKHGMKYGQALKAAKATYKRGGALYPAGY